MNSWCTVILGNLIEHRKGFAFKSSDLKPGWDVNVIRLTNIIGDKIELSKCDKVTLRQAALLQEYRLLTNDVIIATVGSWPSNPASVVGKVVRVDDKTEGALLNQNAVILRAKPDLDQLFMYYMLKNTNFQNYIISTAQGSANQASIKLSDIYSYEFKLPSLPEQQAIAEVLSSLDDKIDLLHRNNKTLEEMAEVLFHYKFIENADDNWETNTLGELFDIGIGRTPPRKESEWFSNCPDDVKWASIKDMGNSGVYLLTTAETLTTRAVEQFNIPIVPPYTALLSFKMTLGRVGITSEYMVTNEAIAHFKLKPHTFMFTEFIYLYLKTYKWEQLGSTSSIVDAINSRMIKDIEITVPSDSTLLNFRKQIQPLFEKIKQNQEQILCLQKTRNLLIPKLISGVLKVNDFTQELSVL